MLAVALQQFPMTAGWEMLTSLSKQVESVCQQDSEGRRRPPTSRLRPPGLTSCCSIRCPHHLHGFTAGTVRLSSTRTVDPPFFWPVLSQELAAQRICTYSPPPPPLRQTILYGCVGSFRPTLLITPGLSFLLPDTSASARPGA
jgi:hypothetical protein